MPNWTMNVLTVTGPPKVVAAFRQKARGSNPNYVQDPMLRAIDPDPAAEIVTLEDLCFHALVPVPAGLLRRSFGAEAEQKAGRDLPIDGHRSGYSWQSANWGTKWGACNVSLDATKPTRLVYEFETAWSPPNAWLLRVSAMFPELAFINMWRDEYDGYKELHGDAYAAGKPATFDFGEWPAPPRPSEADHIEGELESMAQQHDDVAHAPGHE